MKQQYDSLPTRSFPHQENEETGFVSNDALMANMCERWFFYRCPSSRTRSRKKGLEL